LKLDTEKYDDYTELDFDINDFKIMVIDGEDVMMGKPTLDVTKSGSNDFTISIKKAARGRTRDYARDAAEDVIYNYELKDSTITFDPYFLLEEGGKWRDQDVDIVVKVPEGKTIYLGEEMVKIIHDIENVSNTWDGDMVEKYWVMKPEGLTMKEMEEN
jgi:hypothetical protein